MDGFDPETLARALDGRAPRPVYTWLRARQAAVAVVLDPAGRVLLCRRARRKGDRWSSHVSFPGGMRDAVDATLLDTALRETREEVGLDLADARRLGALDQVRAVDHGGRRPMSISPFVFAVDTDPPLAPGPEVASAFWLPLDRAARGEFDGRLRHPLFGVPMTFPCWRFEGHVVWGLTYGMLRTVLALGAGG